MTVSIGLQFIEPPSNFTGATLGSVRYQYGHRVAYLPERLLGAGSTVLISSIWFQSSGFTGAGGGKGAFLLFRDPWKSASNKSLYPLTQNTPYMFQALIGQMDFAQNAGITLPQVLQIDPPIPYVVGRDCIVYCSDTTLASSSQILNCWGVGLTMDAEPAWTSGNPADMPSPNDPGGNDQYCYLLLHGTDGPNGSPSFQDHSWRNYTVRWYGNCRLNGGYYQFDGTNSCMAPELYDPGSGTDTNPAHNDWNPGSADFTLEAFVKPSAATSFGAVVSFAGSYSPFVIVQQGTGYTFYASTTGASWNVAAGVSMGPAPVGAETHLAVVRHGSQILLFNNGVQVGAALSVTGALYYPLDGSGTLPKGRLVFGAQADINGDGNVSGGSWFKGAMREMRYSKIARWTSSFTPPATPYSP